MALPVATDGAAPLTGLVRSEFIVAQEGQTTLPLSGWVSTRSHPTVSRDSSKARLTRRRYPGDERVEIASDAWRFARVETGMGLDFQGTEQAIIESDTHIHMQADSEPGWIYELVYEGRDPLVLGLGYVAVRDLVSFLKYEEFDSETALIRWPGRPADGEGLCLRPLADGALHPRCDLSRLQRRCGRAQGVRRRAGARRRLRAHVG